MDKKQKLARKALGKSTAPREGKRRAFAFSHCAPYLKSIGKKLVQLPLLASELASEIRQSTLLPSISFVCNCLLPPSAPPPSTVFFRLKQPQAQQRIHGMIEMPAATPAMMRTVLVDLPDDCRVKVTSVLEMSVRECDKGAATDGWMKEMERKSARWAAKVVNIMARTR